MSDTNHPVVLTRAGWLRGAREILPVCAFVFVLGATFGVAARQAGLGPWLATLMSAAVFAGGAQFAALGLLGPPPAMIPLLLGTLAINSRHLLLGAALAPWLSRLPRWQQMAGVTVLSDANWAQAMRAHAAGERDAGVLVGSGATMWAVWVVGTACGALVARSVPDVRPFGLDVLLLAFFAAALTDGWRGRSDLFPAAGAAITTVGAGLLGAGDWSVLLGALGGAVTGSWRDENLR
jgi:predicted branched-subunit amino acid permease